MKTERKFTPTKVNPEFTKAMSLMFRDYRSMSFAERVRYIESRKVVMKPWVEPTEKQERLF